MRPQSPLTTRLPPPNEIGVIPPTPACRAPAPRPDRQGQELQHRLPRGSPVGPAGIRTELTTEDTPHSADSAWLTALSAMGPASRRSNPICAAPACRTEGTIPIPNQADLLCGRHRRQLRSAISVYPPLGLSGSSASRLGGWLTKAGKGRPQRAIGTHTHDPRRTLSRQKRTFEPKAPM